MEIQRLKSDIIAKIRSPSTLSNVSQCVTELVLNSLDAKSNAVAVRVNLITFRLQVVDNGEGITKDNMELAGLRYMTNKCNSLDQLEKQVKHYGFRGETLASIIDMSKSVEITSKYAHSSETYSKMFALHASSEVKLVKTRPSCGTTITLEGFFHNLPIRRNRTVPELELEDIKKNIEHLVIIHPNVSFSIRNDVTGHLILNSKKNNDIISSFKYLHPKIDNEYSLMKVSKLKITVEALLFKGLFDNKTLQYIYVNKRPVYCSKIQKFVANLYYKNQTPRKKSVNNHLICPKNKYPSYVLNIKCPYSNVDILLNPSKTIVQFKNLNTVLCCLEKLICSFFGTEKKVVNERYLTASKRVKSECGVSQMCGAHKAYGYKRRDLEKDGFVPEKVRKISAGNVASDIIEETQFSRGGNDFFKGRSRYEDGVMYGSDNELVEDADVNENGVDNSRVLFSDISVDCIKKDKDMKNLKRVPGNFVKDAQNGNLDFIAGGDVYSISDFTPATARKLKKFKEPLPVKISHKSKKIAKTPKPTRKLHQYSNMKISPHKNVTENVTNENLSFCLKNHQNVPDDQKSIKSLYSKFTDDENKGKNLIMDMFLKSTQIYNSEEDIQSDAKSEETLFEVESNFFIENNIQTNVKGISKTKSVSVNIKSTKKIKKPKSKTTKTSKYIQTNLTDNKMVSKCIQTTIDKNETRNNKPPLKKEENIFSHSKLAENYTIVFSDTVRSKRFKFVAKEAPAFDFKPDNLLLTNCNCGCHANANKLFTFNKSRNDSSSNGSPNSVLNKTIKLSGSDSGLEENDVSPIKFHLNSGDYLESLNYDTQAPDMYSFPIENAQKRVLEKYQNFNTHRRKEGQYLPGKPFNEVFLSKNIIGGDKSPYFCNETRHKDKLVEPHLVETQLFLDQPNKSEFSFYEFFNPRCQSTQFNHTRNVQSKNDNHNEELYTLDNFTIDNFGEFQPVYKSTQCNTEKNFTSQLNLGRHKSVKKNVEYNGDNVYNKPFQKDCRDTWCGFNSTSDFYLKSRAGAGLTNLSEYHNLIPKGQVSDMPYVCPLLPTENFCAGLANEAIIASDEPSKLVITLSNQERENILKNELIMEKDFNKKRFLYWDSQMISVCKEGAQEFGGEWVKKFNNLGSSFYVNKRTGFTTFLTPKPDSNQFRFDRRLEFMPKGLSPIMKDLKKVDQSLSQNKKDLLQNYILESHQDDLLVVKWQNYIKNNDPKEFFEEVYREKVKDFGDCIPSISTIGNKKCLELNGIISFDKALFDNITVIGQVDRKFIAAIEKTKNLIILFDQHAVHERIRVEDLLKAYTGAKIECDERFIIFMPQNDLSLLRKHEFYLNSVGLSVEFFENGITVSGIPLCLYRKFKDNYPENGLNKAVQLFINEIIGLLKVTRGVSLKNLPPILQNIINLEACRGAIKFGDSLATKDCSRLLQKLSDCKLPFQCAHGRPTLTPLVTLDLPTKILPQWLNLKKIKI